MIRRQKPGLLAIACDICSAVCPGSAKPTFFAARRAARNVGWRKRNGVRRCPACATTKAATAATPVGANT